MIILIFGVVFEVLIMIFTYSWRVVPSIYLVVRILKRTVWYSEIILLVSLVILLVLKRTLELIKLSLWRSNNQTYHLWFLRDSSEFLVWRFNSIVILVFIWLGDGSRFNKSCLHDLGVPNHHCYRVSSQLLVKFISLSFKFLDFFSIFLEFSISRRIGTERNYNFYFLSFKSVPNQFWLKMNP